MHKTPVLQQVFEPRIDGAHSFVAVLEMLSLHQMQFLYPVSAVETSSVRGGYRQ